MQIHFVAWVDGVRKVRICAFGCNLCFFVFLSTRERRRVRLCPFGCVPASMKVTRGADTLIGVATRRGEGAYECFLGVTCVFLCFSCVF